MNDVCVCVCVFLLPNQPHNCSHICTVNAYELVELVELVAVYMGTPQLRRNGDRGRETATVLKLRIYTLLWSISHASH